MEIGVTVGDSIDRIERTASEFGFVEFGIGEAIGIPKEIDTDQLRRALNKVGTEFYVHLPYEQVVATPVPEINTAIVEYMQRLLDWAGSMGAKKAVLHGTTRDPYEVAQRDLVSDQLRKIGSAGEEQGIEIVVENVGHQRAGLQLSVLGDIARETDTSVCFDVGHAYMEDGQDGINRFLSRYGELVTHLHVHDVRRRGDTHIPIGSGEIDYSVLAEYVSEYSGSIAIEVFTDDGQLLHDSASRIRQYLHT